MKTTIKKSKRLRKGRCIAFLVLLLMLFLFFIQGFSQAAATNEGRTINEVYVLCGDTLWSLVEEFYDYRGDIRNAILEVQRLNNLSGSRLYSGQVLLIPAYYKRCTVLF